MVRLRLGAVLVSAVVTGLLLTPAPIEARQQGGSLRGGLSAIVRGHRSVDTRIASRSQAGAREIAVSVELGSVPDQLTRERLRAAGLTTRGSWRTTIEGYVAPNRLRDIAEVTGVRSVTPIRRPLASAYVGPAPAVHGATSWQQAGYRGTGIKIGILDSGFDGFAGLMATELPSTVAASCYQQIGTPSTNLADCVTPGNSHGTAVAESIIDMAPGASLYVSNAYSPADLAATISWMTAAGVRIINYSRVSSLLIDGMGDGTSPYSDSAYALVDQAVAGGALFVASAGNEGETSWMGPATDADGNGWLDFAPGDETDALDLSAGDEIRTAIRWDSPASDYDLSIWQGDTKVAESADFQSDTGDPFELVDFRAASAGTYEISIWHDAGPVAPTIRLMVHTAANTALNYRTTVGTLPTPADSRNPGLLAVGAVDYRTPSTIEPYSSQGPTLDGRVKPDLVAVDCAPTTISPEFCGTSQSAPLVTGAAALLLEADLSLTPASLAALIKQQAVPLGSPVPNNAFGYGRLALGPLPTTVPAAASFVAPPASGTAGNALLGQPTLAIVDANGRVTGTGPGATMPVTLSLNANPAGATLTCAGGTTRTAIAGIAAFGGCSVDLAGTDYTIQADVPGLASATSAPFTIAPPGTAPQVALAMLPTTVTVGKATAGAIGVALPEGAGLPATFEWSTDTKAWTAVDEVVLDPTGAGRVSTSPRRHGYWRVRTVLPDGSVAVSAAILVRVNATAVLASSVPSGRTVRRTARIILTETIRPAGADVARGRARFDFFLQVGTKWVRKRTLYAYADPASSRARVIAALPSAGRWWVRSRAESTATNGASAWTSGVKYRVP